MNKNQARQVIIRKLRTVPNRDNHLYQELFKLPQWINSDVIATTISTPIELDTKPIIKRAWQTGKQVVVPKIYSHRRMKFIKDSAGTQLNSNYFGILEPIDSPKVSKGQIDLIIVPGLCFSIRTYDRLGFGGGYYDRYLKGCPAYKVALARSAQVFQQPFWSVEKYDVKMDLILY